MNVANLELCKELYELSGWVNDIHWIEQGRNEHLAPQDNYPNVAVHDDAMSNYPYFKKKLSPAYDLGYLLRKLPPVIQQEGLFLALAIHAQGDGTWHMTYAEPYDKEFKGSFITNADTPENAAAKLAIELFKEGVLK